MVFSNVRSSFKALTIIGITVVLVEIILTLHSHIVPTKVITSTTNIKNIIYTDSNQKQKTESQTSQQYTVKERDRYACRRSQDKPGPSCSKLIAGDEQEQNLAKRFTRSCRKIAFSDEEFVNMTKDCKSYRINHNYFTEATEEEIRFPIAFSVMMYKDVNQVERLLKTIYRPHNYYCFHVDASASETVLAAMKGIVQCLPNVELASRFVDVKWGKFSVLESELVCMADLLNHRTWKYLINLTGQEYPLKTNLQLVRILTVLNGANSVDGDQEHYSRWKGRWRRAGKPPHGITPIKGNLHVVLNREFVNYAINDQVSKDLLQWLQNTIVPDEAFFNSLNFNPQLGIPGSYTGKNITTNWKTKPYIARYKSWHPNHAPNSYFHFPCYGKRVRGICIFGLGDLPILTKRVELFANKFHWNYMSITLDCMEEWYRSIVETELRNKGDIYYNTTYYQNMSYLKEIVKPYYTDSETMEDTTTPDVTVTFS